MPDEYGSLREQLARMLMGAKDVGRGVARGAASLPADLAYLTNAALPLPGRTARMESAERLSEGAKQYMSSLLGAPEGTGALQTAGELAGPPVKSAVKTAMMAKELAPLVLGAGAVKGAKPAATAEKAGVLMTKDGRPYKIDVEHGEFETKLTPRDAQTGEPIGSMNVFHADPHENMPAQVENVAVEPLWGRQGIASSLYNEAEKHVGPLSPSGSTTPAGQKFWLKRNPAALEEMMRRELDTYAKGLHEDNVMTDDNVRFMLNQFMSTYKDTEEGSKMAKKVRDMYAKLLQGPTSWETH